MTLLIVMAGLVPDINARLRDDGAEVTPIPVGQFSAFMKTEAEKYQQIIKEAGLKPE